LKEKEKVREGTKAEKRRKVLKSVRIVANIIPSSKR